MLSRNELTYGDIKIVMYDFSEEKDILPSHVHLEDKDLHISIVARGSVRVFGEDFSVVCTNGTILDFKKDQVHGFEALEKNSRIINVNKYMGEYATEVKRDSPLIDAVATKAGLTVEQIDQMFIEASTL
jgi:hypothetical protein